MLYVYITDAEYAIAERNGISKANVYNRVNHLGWSVERAITESIRKPDAVRMKYLQLAKKNNISATLYCNRLKEGWGYREAATTPKIDSKDIGKIRRERNIRTVLNDEHIEEYKKNNIPYGTVIARIRTYGWSIKRAITEPVHAEFRKKSV